MPTYEYRCEACGHDFEAFQSIKAEPIKKCPECGKKKVKRLMGIGAGVIFKGSGFYETDYRSESYKKAAKADSDAGSEKKAESKSETKTESPKADAPAKSEPKPAAEAKPAKSKKKDE